MEEIHYEAVKALVEQWDYDWGCGPFEDCLPEEDEVRKLNDWTGRIWTAEDGLQPAPLDLLEQAGISGGRDRLVAIAAAPGEDRSGPQAVLLEP